MKSVAEMIAVMQAAERGETIEVLINSCTNVWATAKTPCWNWEVNDYRVKPQPKTRPFRREDVTDEVRWIRNRDWAAGIAESVCGIGQNGIYALMRSEWIWSYLADHCEWSSSMNGPWHPFTVEEP